MGKDLEIVAYRGPAVADRVIVELVSRFAPETAWFRHATATIIDDLRCIAFYEAVHGDDDAAGLDFPESTLRAVDPDASLSSIVQAAWKMTREQVRTQPAKPAPAPTPEGAVGIARELSKRGGDAFVVGYGDHSCIGIYGQFRDGALIDPSDERDIYRDHDDYTAAPSRAWSRALGRDVAIDDVVAAYFPDHDQPPLVSDTRSIPFDADRFMMTLVE